LGELAKFHVLNTIPKGPSISLVSLSCGFYLGDLVNGESWSNQSRHLLYSPCNFMKMNSSAYLKLLPCHVQTLRQLLQLRIIASLLGLSCSTVEHYAQMCQTPSTCTGQERYGASLLASNGGRSIKSMPTSHTPSRQCLGHLECDYSLEDHGPKHVPPPIPCHAMFFFPCLGREASSQGSCAIKLDKVNNNDP
jgi:hypothetical protein